MEDDSDDQHEIKNVINQNNHHKLLLILIILRIMAGIGTLGSGVSMATSSAQTLPFSINQFLQFRVQYNDFPAFTFFLIANCIGCGYLIFSLPFYIFHILRRTNLPKLTRIILVIFDVVMLVVVTSGASAAISIVHLAHQGNSTANWLPICPPFTHFCNSISASLIASFFSILIFMLVIITSLIYL